MVSCRMKVDGNYYCYSHTSKIQCVCIHSITYSSFRSSIFASDITALACSPNSVAFLSLATALLIALKNYDGGGAEVRRWDVIFPSFVSVLK